MVNRLLLVIIVKWIGISNHCRCCRSIRLQKQRNRLIAKRSDLWSPDTGRWGAGRLDGDIKK